MQKGRSSLVVIITLVIFTILAAKFVYLNVTPQSLVGVSHYKNLLGQEAICSLVPYQNGCFGLYCITDICIIPNPANPPRPATTHFKFN